MLILKKLHFCSYLERQSVHSWNKSTYMDRQSVNVCPAARLSRLHFLPVGFLCPAAPVRLARLESGLLSIGQEEVTELKANPGNGAHAIACKTEQSPMELRDLDPQTIFF